MLIARTYGVWSGLLTSTSTTCWLCGRHGRNGRHGRHGRSNVVVVEVVEVVDDDTAVLSGAVQCPLINSFSPRPPDSDPRQQDPTPNMNTPRYGEWLGDTDNGQWRDSPGDAASLTATAYPIGRSPGSTGRLPCSSSISLPYSAGASRLGPRLCSASASARASLFLFPPCLQIRQPCMLRR